ncbi:MAG: pilin [Woeseiaceae bacterium]
MNLTGGAKAAATEFYQDQGAFPANNTQAGLAANTAINGKQLEAT